MQAATVKLFGNTLTVAHHLRLQIEPHDLHFALTDIAEQMMERKGQIALATTEVDNAQHSIAWQLRQDICHQFQKPVDLPELRLLCGLDLTARRHHADLLHEGARLAFRNQILLAPVMGKCRCLT